MYMSCISSVTSLLRDTVGYSEGTVGYSEGTMGYRGGTVGIQGNTGPNQLSFPLLGRLHTNLVLFGQAVSEKMFEIVNG